MVLFIWLIADRCDCAGVARDAAAAYIAAAARECTVDHILLKQWRQCLGITQESAAKLLRCSSSRYSDMEKGVDRARGAATAISAATAELCLLRLVLCQDYEHVDDMIASLQNTEASIQAEIENLKGKAFFQKLRRQQDKVKAARVDRLKQQPAAKDAAKAVSAPKPVATAPLAAVSPKPVVAARSAAAKPKYTYNRDQIRPDRLKDKEREQLQAIDNEEGIVVDRQEMPDGSIIERRRVAIDD